MITADYYKAVENGYIECLLCPRECKIGLGKKGFCNIRENRDGVLYSTGYARTISIAVDPIEKKPLYHFYPGTRILSIGPNGCNLDCQFCQNYEISKLEATTETLLPTSLIQLAEQNASIGIAYTYTEPLIWFEYLRDAAPLVKSAGLKNVLVTNGYINEEPLSELLPNIDAMNIDIKSMNPEFYRKVCLGELSPVLRTAALAVRFNVHVEITNLVIPTLNDGDDDFRSLSRWMREYLGDNAVLHLSAYFPRYKMSIEQTPLSTLRRAKEIASEYLRYVYIGNVQQNNNTLCPYCGDVLIKREGYKVQVLAHKNPTRCPRCQNRIAINIT